MSSGLPLDRMTAAEELQALGQIWESLAGKPRALPSPAWHGEVLKQREARVRKGELEFADWDEAKRSIRENAE